MRFPYSLLLLLGCALAATGRAWADNVDLSTVPPRSTVQLTIYNSEDLTLVRETRELTFHRGNNPLQFSWANTLIDPTSVELKFKTHADQLEVLDTTFPHDKPQMLYWNVHSEREGAATIEISYFTSGISWAADYVLVADQGESLVAFEGYVRVFNNSGEEYEDAQVRLVVGRVNLVEKIAQLANVPLGEVDSLAPERNNQLRLYAARELAMTADDASAGAGPSGSASAPKEIIKEGLSEYFIFTIEGTETIANGWSKRLRSVKPVEVPLKIQYRYREPEYGPQLVRMYLMKNDTESQLGETPLPDGMVRVFRDNGRDGLSFLTAQSVPYIPIGDKLELNLGVDPEVIFELIKKRTSREEVWMQLNGADVFRKVGAPGVEIDVRSSVAGWDDHVWYVQRVRNYTAKPIELEVRRAWDGHVEFQSKFEALNHDYRTIQYTATAPAAQTLDLPYELVIHQGRNHKQNHVTPVRLENPR